MYGTVLSVLLMGMVPALPSPVLSNFPPDLPAISSPTPVEEGRLSSAVFGRTVSASGFLIVDLQSGQEIFQRNASDRRPMGSLTKLMTALLIVEHHSLTDVVAVPVAATKIEGSKASLPSLSHFTVGDLLSALLLPSGNDAAYTLALYHSGSEAAFVAQMNARAQELGLQDTSFANAEGLDDSQQWSSARDIAWLAAFVWRNPALRKRMSSAHLTIRSLEGHAITLSHTHLLLHQVGPVIAGKTGTTDAAKQCLLSIIQEGKREYVVVLLGSRERYTDMRAVLKSLGEILL